MNLLNSKISLQRKEACEPQVFWNWFARRESAYRLGHQSPGDFLDAALGQLQLFDPWLKLLVGSHGDGVRELIVTADGDVALFPRVFQLVQAAPALTGWRVTALKQARGMAAVRVDMEGRRFSADTMRFYVEQDAHAPDEVCLVLAHADHNGPDDDLFQNGGMIYLENALGELAAATRIDRYRVGPLPEDESRLIALDKLPDYLLWREKETIRICAGEPLARPLERWRLIEAEDDCGRPMLAAFDRAYHDWPYRPLYPWLIAIHLHYPGRQDGLPDEKQWTTLQKQEDDLLTALPMEELILLSHKTYDHQRIIYLYARDYWRSAEALHNLHKGSFEMDFYITKDRYWKIAGDRT